MRKLTIFESKVLNAVKKIPAGRVITYKLLAKVTGQPKAIRAVGNALNKNPNLIKIPCHRVVRSDGGIGGYRAGILKKISLLKKEGIEFKNNKVKNLNKFL